MFENDSLLWQAFREGNPQAFEAIYHKYVRPLYNYGYNLTRDAAAVEDAIQDLFIYLHEHQATLGATDNIKFYLLRSLRRILAKRATQRAQSQAPEQTFENALFVSEENPLFFAEQEAQAVQYKQIIRQIDQLPKRQKEAMFLLYIHGLSYPEVAQVMELETKSVYNLINKAIHTLRENLRGLLLMLLSLFYLIFSD
jgi:RNA polymerase sigma-70 factor (ECF subfamily)